MTTTTKQSTTKQSTTFQSEPYEHRLQEYSLLLEMIVASIEVDVFTGQQREEKTAALSRLADKI